MEELAGEARVIAMAVAMAEEAPTAPLEPAELVAKPTLPPARQELLGKLFGLFTEKSDDTIDVVNLEKCTPPPLPAPTAPPPPPPPLSPSTRHTTVHPQRARRAALSPARARPPGPTPSPPPPPLPSLPSPWRRCTIKEGPHEKKLLSDLKSMDANSDGQLTLEEMTDYFAVLGESLNDDEFELIIGEMVDACETNQLAAQLAAFAAEV